MEPSAANDVATPQPASAPRSPDSPALPGLAGFLGLDLHDSADAPAAPSAAFRRQVAEPALDDSAVAPKVDDSAVAPKVRHMERSADTQQPQTLRPPMHTEGAVAPRRMDAFAHPESIEPAHGPVSAKADSRADTERGDPPQPSFSLDADGDGAAERAERTPHLAINATRNERVVPARPLEPHVRDAQRTAAPPPPVSPSAPRKRAAWFVEGGQHIEDVPRSSSTNTRLPTARLTPLSSPAPDRTTRTEAAEVASRPVRLEPAVAVAPPIEPRAPQVHIGRVRVEIVTPAEPSRAKRAAQAPRTTHPAETRAPQGPRSLLRFGLGQI
jgi:hypothetical protein